MVVLQLNSRLFKSSHVMEADPRPPFPARFGKYNTQNSIELHKGIILRFWFQVAEFDIIQAGVHNEFGGFYLLSNLRL